MENTLVQCPALVVTAPSSGSGKTTVVAALARHFHLQGKRVRVFKTGPDFIDPRFFWSLHLNNLSISSTFGCVVNNIAKL